MNEDIIISEYLAEGYFTTYLLYKYEFLLTDAYKNCPNKKICDEDNFHFCGCFKQYLAERNHRALIEMEIRERIENEK